eukprot:TRINITY_DN8272_c0_g1_i1.p1 TRINITY_DN8272_c0_g1~~TRINITY_DN8272_c0_g1_i1.p1  ORF type:complete len:180 (-),score=23.35 TRINITY_DN8272_c0_g1_i1:89-628(-)
MHFLFLCDSAQEDANVERVFLAAVTAAQPQLLPPPHPDEFKERPSATSIGVGVTGLASLSQQFHALVDQYESPWTQLGTCTLGYLMDPTAQARYQQAGSNLDNVTAADFYIEVMYDADDPPLPSQPLPYLQRLEGDPVNATYPFVGQFWLLNQVDAQPITLGGHAIRVVVTTTIPLSMT